MKTLFCSKTLGSTKTAQHVLKSSEFMELRNIKTGKYLNCQWDAKEADDRQSPINEPDIFLDEPTNGVDLNGRRGYGIYSRL